MINYTTPSITLTVEGADLTTSDVYVSLIQGNKELVKTGDSLVLTVDKGDTTIVFVLTQEESASFDYNKSVAVQVNWITAENVRSATTIASIGVMRNLLDEVIEYGN